MLALSQKHSVAQPTPMVTRSDVTIIKSRQRLSLEDLREVWRHRELLYFFTWRDIKVRYKQTAIGVLWAILQPTVTMVVFTVVFGRLANIPSEGVPYPIFVFAGLLFWQLFSRGLAEASNSLIENQSLVTKAPFPRVILPLSAITTQLVDFFFAVLVFVSVLVYYSITPRGLGLLLLPVFLLITLLAVVGGGLLLAAVNVKYRDVRYAAPFFIQLLLFVTPVIYPASLAGKFAWVLALNPMTGVITTARATLLGRPAVDWSLLVISSLAAVVIFFVGVLVFKKTERYFADII